jgi:hypothetical protein
MMNRRIALTGPTLMHRPKVANQVGEGAEKLGDRVRMAAARMGSVAA